MKFTELDIHPDILKAVEDVGFTDLTPIQEQSLAPALEGRDVAGIAQTGTGKTIAFLLPILHRRCVMCHGPEYQMGEFDIRSKTAMLAPPLSPGHRGIAMRRPFSSTMELSSTSAPGA